MLGLWHFTQTLAGQFAVWIFVRPQLAGERDQQKPGVIARSWFLTFACCGFLLMLNKSRGQLRLIITNQECSISFHPTN